MGSMLTSHFYLDIESPKLLGHRKSLMANFVGRLRYFWGHACISQRIAHAVWADLL
jgi:hypothetical protein